METPASLKLKDGAMLAFVFTGDDDAAADFYVESPNLAELYGDDA